MCLQQSGMLKPIFTFPGRSFLIAACFAGAFFAAGSPSRGAAVGSAGLATFHAETSEAQVAFFGTDQNNQAVGTLSRDDFAVVDNGEVVRDFRELERSGAANLDVVALVDSSESVASSLFGLKVVLHQMAKEVGESTDRLSIISFGAVEPRLLCSDDCSSEASQKRLDAIEARGGTPLYDALVFGARFAAERRRPGVSQLLVVFSDGADTLSRSTNREALEASLAAGSALYALDLNSSRREAAPRDSLREIADATGGRSLPLSAIGASLWQLLHADSRATYLVSYELPGHELGFHSLRILPKHNLNLRFHCRSGYDYQPRIP